MGMILNHSNHPAVFSRGKPWRLDRIAPGKPHAVKVRPREAAPARRDTESSSAFVLPGRSRLREALGCLLDVLEGHHLPGLGLGLELAQQQVVERVA